MVLAITALPVQFCLGTEADVTDNSLDSNSFDAKQHFDLLLFALLQDLHTLNLTHYSYGGAKITWSQLVKKMGNNKESKSDGVRRFENHLSSKSGMSNLPQSFYTVNINW